MAADKTTHKASTPSAAQIRAIFGDNLRSLCAHEKSVSQACRAIGVNRAQFSRYLSGEAFPCPDLLLRICDYFHVDADILIKPLPRTPPPTDVLAQSFQHLASLLPGQSYATSEQQLPTGVYRIWRRSFMWPDYTFRCHCRIWRQQGITHSKAYEPSVLDLLHLGGQPTLPERRSPHGIVMRRHNGVVLNVNHALCILSAPSDGSPVMRMVTLQPGFEGIATLYSGICALMQGQQRAALSACPIVLEPVALPFPQLLRAAREKYFHQRHDLPARLGRYLYDTPVL